MPSLKDLRNRIASTKATQKITKAMQMVAASKLRRAQAAAEAARPYAQQMTKVLGNIAAAVGDLGAAPRLLVGTGSERVHLLLVCTAERGLCGPFNSAIVRLARERANALMAEGKEVKFFCVGRKGYEQLRRLYEKQIIPPVFETPSPPSPASGGGLGRGNGGAAYEYEPEEEEILAELLPRNIAVQIFRALLENAASEQGSRMTAMDNATRNAGDMINRLSIQYNRQRQAAITTELVEIISGAEAL